MNRTDTSRGPSGVPRVLLLAAAVCLPSLAEPRLANGQQPERTLKLDPGGALCLALTQDARLPVAGVGPVLRLWDTTTAKELATLRGHTYAVMTLAFSPDGKSLASGSAAPDSSIRL